MSLPPAIPWQVALPQSLPPLRRVITSMRYSRFVGPDLFIQR